MKHPALQPKPTHSPKTNGLREQAEARLRQQHPKAKSSVPKSDADPRRQLHELQVHQVELELQNTELQEARNRMEVLLEKYTDLYDFAPVGYLSLDQSGVIREANLTGAALLDVERSRLINRRLPLLVAPTSRLDFLDFLNRIFAGTGKQACEAMLIREDGTTFWGELNGSAAISPGGPGKWCRVAIADITERKRAEGAQHRFDELAALNRKLEQEIVRREVVEKSLEQSEEHARQLLEESRQMHNELQLLSRKILLAQEEERKKISRELHDVIAQTLTSINVRLATLKKQAVLDPKNLERSISHTQELVEHSVNVVHRFARELRPTVLDDLGLIPALQTFMKTFKAQTGIHVSLSAFAAVEQLNGDKRTVLFRVAQEALTNIARHAQASRADVSIQKLDGAICLKIKDNGKGLPAERVLHSRKQKRLGLLGMRERAEMVGGNFTIESVPGKGTTILAQIPLANVRGGGGFANLIGKVYV
jgi:PAS domain S-box-containing protein